MAPHPIRITPEGAGPRWPQLDGLRGLAVLAVLAQHAYPRLGHSIPAAHSGVRLFFVLSGFLITGILLRARERVDTTGRGGWSEFAGFQARRVARIFPAYYLVITIGLLAGVGPIGDAWPWLISFTTNGYIALRDEWVAGYFHFWTLAIEAQFYLFWSLFVLFAPRRWLLPAVAVMLAVAPLYRAVAVYLGLGTIALFCATPSCLDTLGAGALVAILTLTVPPSVLVHTSLARWACGLGWAAVVALWAARSFGQGWLNDIWLDSALALACAGLVLVATRGMGGVFGRMLTSRPLRFIGTISYGAYVYHVFLPALTLALLPRVCAALGVVNPGPGPGVFAVITVGIVVIPVLSWYFFEQPINRLGSRAFAPSRPETGSLRSHDPVAAGRFLADVLPSAPNGPTPVAVTIDPQPGPVA
jgi:peptidoglycan/LPS O-acetylase OafA/YrhL